MTRIKRAIVALAVMTVLAALALFPTRPAPLTGPVNSPRPPAVAIPTPEGTPTLVSTRGYMISVMDNIDNYWDDVFTASGILFVPDSAVAYIMLGEVYVSNCIDDSGFPVVVPYNYPNAFYCTVDGPTGTIVLPVGSFMEFLNADIFNRYAPGAGYFSMAVVEAHEYGHYVQAILDVITNIPISPGKNKELMADCFAGTWTNGLEREGNLLPGDYGEAIATFSVIGDEVGSHGTNRERVDAYNLGYFSGSPLLCIDSYPMPNLPPQGEECAIPCIVGTVSHNDPSLWSNLSKLSRW